MRDPLGTPPAADTLTHEELSHLLRRARCLRSRTLWAMAAASLQMLRPALGSRPKVPARSLPTAC
ncbi:MAG: hypothetical protein ACTS3R_08735 [Inquilinaceae bacterium]